MNNKDKRIKDAEEKIAMFNYITTHVIKLNKKLSLNYEEKSEENKNNVILDVQNVQKYYSTNKKVLDQITFKVNTGEFFGIVGESGSGKSTLGKIIIRIIDNSGGTILFDDRFISSKKLLKSTKKWLSQNIQMVFQSPISSLNPKKKVLDLVKEPLLSSSLISDKVDLLIKIHKILNYIFQFRIKILIETFNLDFYKKYYSILLYSYFTFNIKYQIYLYYLNTKKGNIKYEDTFLTKISSLYNRYKNETYLDEGFLGPLYNVSNPKSLQIYQPINLSKEQKAILLNKFIHDTSLLDAYDINLSNSINDINDLFVDLKDADDFMISAVDELDNNIKLVLNIAAKHFTNITDITRIILRKIARKDYFEKEKQVIEAYNEYQKNKDILFNNPLHNKINKIIKKKNLKLADFKNEYNEKTGISAKSILLTYLSTSKEEIASVNRSMVNNNKNPIMFLYYDIKKATLQERYNVIKTFSTLSNLTSGQINFLIDKVWVAIQNKYEPLFEQLKEVENANINKTLSKLDIANKLADIKTQLHQKWEEYGKDLSEYKKAVDIAKTWGKENKDIYNQNIKKVNQQISELKALDEQLQKNLNNRSDEQLIKEQYDDSLKNYEQAMKEYLVEMDETDVINKNKWNQLKEESKNIISQYDPLLISFMKNSDDIFKDLTRLIKKNSVEYKEDRTAIIQDLSRVKIGIQSSFLEVQEIIKNSNTYIELYIRPNPTRIRNKLIKHLTKLYVFETLESVGLKQEHAFRYIYEFSGGQRQRIAIARALATHPKLIIADEPISALDVSIQAQVVNIMKNLAKERNITFLFIAHDLSMVHYACDRMIIINKGHILEKGNTNDIFEHPSHPYTRTLLKAVPELSNINLNLAKESDKVNQPYGSYNPIENPGFYSVNDKIEHYVFGTKEQIQKWNPELKEIKH